MKRRSLVGALAGAAIGTSPAIVPAQGRLRRVGVLSVGATASLVGPDPSSATAAALLGGMRDLGEVWGRDFVTEARGTEGEPDRVAPLAEELLRAGVDVIVAAGPSLPTLHRVTQSVPIVMCASGDPVGEGLVASLSHPGGNFTGLSNESVELTGKRLSLAKQIAPGVAPVGVLWDAASRHYWLAAERVAKQQGWTVLSLELHEAGDLESALRRASALHAGALLVSAAGLLYPRARDLAQRAIESRLPTMCELRPYVESGGLAAYGADIEAAWRQAAGFVHRILKGARPRDLPVEQPTRFELAVNLTTAAALGVALPPAVLLEASKVIR
jgi:putative ABC transport system substrate-binding protein